MQENWALPIWLERQKLSAQVQIWIDASGRLLRFAFVKTSGNAQFDEAVNYQVLQGDDFQSIVVKLFGKNTRDAVGDRSGEPRVKEQPPSPAREYILDRHCHFITNSPKHIFA